MGPSEDDERLTVEAEWSNVEERDARRKPTVVNEKKPDALLLRAMALAGVRVLVKFSAWRRRNEMRSSSFRRVRGF
jgi:hypothetical protein